MRQEIMGFSDDKINTDILSILNYMHGWQGSAISGLNYGSSSSRSGSKESYSISSSQFLPSILHVFP